MAKKRKTEKEEPQLSAAFVEEVEEELRQEKVKKAWRRFGPPAVGLAIAIVVSVFGWSSYTAFQERKAQEQSDRYVAAARQIKEGQNAEAQAIFKKLSDEGSPGYQFASQMQLAALDVSEGNKQKALDLYGAILSSDLDLPYRNLALISAARLTIGDEEFKQFQSQLDVLAESDTQMRWLAQEIKGLNDLSLGDKEGATKIFNIIVEAQGAPLILKQRATLVLETVIEP